MHLQVEILLSTMLREDLSFLNQIFKHNNINDFYLLIINQTTQDKILKSDNPKIKVINSFEFGVPKSRNLAIKNATKDICLMADDDISYKPNLLNTINEGYNLYEEASMISFEAVDEHDKAYANYPLKGIHNKQSLKKIYTWVISFRRQDYLDREVFYNTHFGFGATFEGNEEYVFLRNAYDKGLKMFHFPKVIVMHPDESSGRRMGNDNAIFARAALHYRFYGNLSYIWVFKFVFFLSRNKYISIKDTLSKIRIGFEGIQTYKTLKSEGKINQLHES